MRAILLLLLFNFNYCYCQTFNHSSIEETYLFKASYQKTEFEDRCPCEFNTRDKNSSKCSLFRINIKNIYFQRDTSVYSINAFQGIKYMVVDKLNNIPNSGESIIVATNSSSFQYLMFVDTISNLESINTNPIAILIGKRDCIRYTLWQKLQLFLRIRVEKIYEKRKRKEKFQANSFERFILNQK